MLSRFLPALIFLMIALPSHALPVDNKIAEPSPTQHWLTLTSEHFQFQFTKPHEAFARQLATIAEQVHSKLSTLLSWTPHHKTQVVINDATDASNGASTPLPYDQLFIYMTPPAEGDLLSRNRWMEAVFTHEYTHILHHDQATGRPLRLRKIFGATAVLPWNFMSYPQQFAPNWLSEGIAIYMESLSGEGRNHSAIYDAKMREEVRKGLNSLTQESYEGYEPARWPFGHVYLYGAYFFQFVASRYGQEKVLEYITNYSDNLIPWRMENRARETFGISAKALWHQFQDYLKQRFQPEIASILAAGETPGKIVADTPFINHFVTHGPDGSVFYYHHDLISSPEIRQTFPDGKTTTIRKIRGVTFLDWRRGHGLLIGQKQICNNTSVYGDILVLKPGSQKPERITHCARIKTAVWATDGQNIYAVQTGNGESTLSQVSPTGEITSLWQTTAGEVLGQIAASPDSHTLALQVKTPQSGWNIEVFSLQNHSRQTLTHNHDIEINPRYSADGQSLYFISDHGNRMELRKLDLASGHITTLTNSPGYIITASIDSNDVVTVSEYTGKGQRLRRLTTHQTYAEPYSAITAQVTPSDSFSLHPDFLQQHQKISAAPVTEYQPLQTLRPFGWAPILNINDSFDSQLGIQLSGQDILGFHQWSATPVFFNHQDVNSIGGALSYSYYNRVIVSGSRTITTGGNEDNRKTTPTPWDDEHRLQLLIQKPWNHRDSGWRLGVGSAWERSHHHNGLASQHSEDQISGIDFTFNNLQQYGQSISPTEGIALNVTAETYDLGGNSDHQGNALIASIAGMLNMGGNHTLFVKLTSGTGDHGIKPFSLGEPDNVIDSISGITRFGARRFALRGYDHQSTLTGNRFLKATAEWRLPMASIYDGFSRVPVGVGKIHGAAFVDTATINNPVIDSNWYTGLGFEITTELKIGFDSFTLPITIGIAQGLDDTLGQSNIYLRSTSTF